MKRELSHGRMQNTCRFAQYNNSLKNHMDQAITAR